ncbi:MAG TPA: TetR/AcrR family transcriptional regulator [Selenomonadales bacterium]|nr:TetR/AcrR family transcriptional regulator [Selenomonadales bacterium]
MGHYRGGGHEDTRSKRQHILEAAYEVFSKKGYHRATVDEIIAMADTGKGTVYNYFTSKEQLFYTLIRERSQPFEKAMSQVADSEEQPLVKIELMVRLALGFYRENADLWRVMMHEIRGFGSEGHTAMAPEIKAKYHEGFRRILSRMEKVLDDGIAQGVLRKIDSTRSAYGLFSVIVMMVYQKFVDEDIETTARQVTDIFLYGAARRS